MKIFLDFDDVLFDTKRFLVEYRSVFARSGVDAEMFERTYASARKNTGGVDGYKYDRHIQILSEEEGRDGRTLHKKINAFVQDLRKYVFPDVRGFLEQGKKRGDVWYLLSSGSPDFQKKKLRGSGLETFFSEVVIVGQEKSSEFSRMIQGGIAAKGDVWFLEDRTEHIDQIKQKFPWVTTVLVSRPEGRYTDAKTNWCDFEVKNLEEARQIINNDASK